MAELLIDHEAELEFIKPSHGTPLMGARTTYNKRDGTQMTAVKEARHYPDIVSLLNSFEEKGIEALNEPRPVRLANMMKFEECLNRISEEKEQQKDEQKVEKRKEEGERQESKEEGCEKN
ncbi:hypothetical protein BHYA_0172g00180 [Botrytis hyacinthi]|uniref:Uncharacterized protein n=1 Tax=Botrytis hyacinthi TaxID=278943 RepID=A0A4Z1GE58_9HELO|nr:hypothetical protein BHYA_0172g00180 [Botrytis hyacinthi]